MDYLNELLATLSARLPELEWKVDGLGSAFLSHGIPRGLFRSNFELTGRKCIDEIKADIQVLSKQKHEASAFYLAQQIQKKINTLVILYQRHSRRNKVLERGHFGVKMLSTRQQWLQALESDINLLLMQQQSMMKTLEQMKLGADAVAILSVQKEVGEIDKRLTLAREALNRAVS
ncbi:MAG: hypothetical protein ACHP65_00205 [Legionellales bacterium]